MTIVTAVAISGICSAAAFSLYSRKKNANKDREEQRLRERLEAIAPRAAEGRS